MIVRPYGVMFTDGLILGPCVFWSLYEVRIGLALVFIEVGIRFNWHLEPEKEASA